MISFRDDPSYVFDKACYVDTTGAAEIATEKLTSISFRVSKALDESHVESPLPEETVDVDVYQHHELLRIVVEVRSSFYRQQYFE